MKKRSLDKEEYPYSQDVYQFSTRSRKCYQEFTEQHPDIEIGKGLYNKILRTYGVEIGQYLIDTGQRYTPPHGLPDLLVVKMQPQPHKLADGTIKYRKSIDWDATRKAGKLIYHLNSHTDGYSAKIMRWHLSGKFHLNNYWAFKAVKRIGMRLAKKLKSPERYAALDSYYEIMPKIFD